MKWTDKLDGEFNGSPCKIRVGVSETYSESAILKLTKMVLNINDFNTCFSDVINSFEIISTLSNSYKSLLTGYNLEFSRALR